MEQGRRFVWVTVVILVVVPVISGPLVSGVSLTSTEATLPASGTGTASVEVISVPTGSVSLDRSDFGAGTFHLAADPAVVEVEAVSGNPRVNYAIDIPALEFTDIHAYQLGKHGTEQLELTFRPVELAPDRIDADTYNATVAVWLVTDENEYTAVYQERITVPVNP